MRAIDVWYERLDVDDLFARWRAEVGKKRLQDGAARRRPRPAPRTACRALSKLTRLVDGEPRFRSDPPLLIPIRELQEAGDDRDIMGEMQRLIP